MKIVEAATLFDAVAMTPTGCWDAASPAMTWKLIARDPAVGLTEAGIVSREFVVVRFTRNELDAAWNRVIVQVAVPPEFTPVVGQLRLATCPSPLPAFRPSVTAALVLLALAVRVAVLLVVNAEAVATKVVEADPAGIGTLAGTCSGDPLPESVTIMVLVVALFKDTVQVLVELLPRVDGEQDREVSCPGRPAVSVKLWVPPFRLALSRAD